jgi:hypothetical protein
MNQIDLGRALKAFFDDKEWPTKTLLGFLWILLGVTAPAAYGAQLDYVRDVSQNKETLPPWDDFGGKWVQGFQVLLAGFLYFLPVAILGAVVFVPAAITAIVSGERNVFGGLLAGGTCIFALFSVIYVIAVSLFYAAAITNFAMKRNFGAFFEFSTIMEKVRGGTGYFSAWLWLIVISFLGSAVTSVLSATGVGSILAPAVAYFVLMASGHVLGQWAALAYGGQPSGTIAPAGVPGGYPPPAPQAYAPPPPPAQPYAPAVPAQPYVEPVAAPPAPEYAPPSAPPAPPTPPVDYTPPPAAPPAPVEPPVQPAPPADATPPAAPAPVEPAPPAPPAAPAPPAPPAEPQ